MPKSSSKVQLNLWVPKDFKQKLERLARQLSYEKDESVTVFSLIFSLVSEYISGSESGRNV